MPCWANTSARDCAGQPSARSPRIARQAGASEPLPQVENSGGEPALRQHRARPAASASPAGPNTAAAAPPNRPLSSPHAPRRRGATLAQPPPRRNRDRPALLTPLLDADLSRNRRSLISENGHGRMTVEHTPHERLAERAKAGPAHHQGRAEQSERQDRRPDHQCGRHHVVRLCLHDPGADQPARGDQGRHGGAGRLDRPDLPATGPALGDHGGPEGLGRRLRQTGPADLQGRRGAAEDPGRRPQADQGQQRPHRPDPRGDLQGRGSARGGSGEGGAREEGQRPRKTLSAARCSPSGELSSEADRGGPPATSGSPFRRGAPPPPKG